MSKEKEKLTEIKGRLKGMLSDWPATTTVGVWGPPGAETKHYYDSTDAPGVKDSLEEIVEEIEALTSPTPEEAYEKATEGLER